MLRNYSQEILNIFESAVKGNRKAFKALMTTEKRPELAAFSNAIKGDVEAELWLRARVSEGWWLMSRALNYDETALKKLQQKEDKFEVCFVLACHNGMEGKHWLEQKGYAHFLPVCKSIASALKAASRERDLGFLYDGSVRNLY